MVKTKFIKSAGRFGARYGQHAKRKLLDIESKQRQKQVCPFCQRKIKRVSNGIWKCKKCKRKFAAHTYFLEKGAIKVRLEKEKPVEGLIKSKPLKQQKTTTKKKQAKKTAPKNLKLKN
jgi:large subunit ribosomal protein L37Ae